MRGPVIQTHAAFRASRALAWVSAVFSACFSAIVAIPACAAQLPTQAGAQAGPPPAMVVCMEEQPHPPHLLADGGGTVPLLLRAAARRAGLPVRLYRAPTRRCLAEMRAGVVHAYAAAAPGPTVTGEFALPMAAGAPDPSRAVTAIRQVVYRRSGSAAGWDGERFSGLEKPVLVGTSFVAIADRLRQLDVHYDNEAGSDLQNLEKLLAHRGDAMVGIDTDVAPLLRQPRYAHAVEALPVPFSENLHYLVVTRPYYRANRAAVEALWDAIGALRTEAGKQGTQVGKSVGKSVGK